MKIMAHQMMLE